MHFLKNKISSDFFMVLSLFVIWRVFLSLVALIGFIFFPLASRNFLAGGYERYNHYFYTLPWANFDGEHYLSIAMIGYKSLQQAFFPFFPLLIHVVSSFDRNNFLLTEMAGLLISNMSFLLALFFVLKLLQIDYSRKIAYGTIIVMLIFPTSFYYGAVYTESVFLLLTVLSFYFFRKKKFWLSALFGILASSSRVFGVLMLPSLLLEAYQSKVSIKQFWPVLLIPLGLGLYMIYLYQTIGDPFAFYNLQSIIGEHRQKGIVLYPQVIYRYLNILFHYNQFNLFLVTFLFEFICGVLFFILPLVGYFRKVRLSYIFYTLVSFIIPTIQGSFSSTSRYVIVLFPAFLLLYLLLEKIPKTFQLVLGALSVLLLGVFCVMFVRGYWVA